MRNANTMLLLDGISPRMIAKNLGITEATVGDQIKSINEQFQVNSVSELAAVFLSNR